MAGWKEYAAGGLAFALSVFSPEGNLSNSQTSTNNSNLENQVVENSMPQDKKELVFKFRYGEGSVGAFVGEKGGNIYFGCGCNDDNGDGFYENVRLMNFLTLNIIEDGKIVSQTKNSGYLAIEKLELYKDKQVIKSYEPSFGVNTPNDETKNFVSGNYDDVSKSHRIVPPSYIEGLRNLIGACQALHERDESKMKGFLRDEYENSHSISLIVSKDGISYEGDDLSKVLNKVDIEVSTRIPESVVDDFFDEGLYKERFIKHIENSEKNK